MVKAALPSGTTLVVEAIYTRAKECLRNKIKNKPYKCHALPAKAPANLDPLDKLKAPGMSVTFLPAGTRQIGSQTCDAYTYSARGSTPTGQSVASDGMLYVSHTTNRPCELDTTMTPPPPPALPPAPAQ